jgi:hypothetical protein
VFRAVLALKNVDVRKLHSGLPSRPPSFHSSATSSSQR